jgi:hypothetical protein
MTTDVRNGIIELERIEPIKLLDRGSHWIVMSHTTRKEQMMVHLLDKVREFREFMMGEIRTSQARTYTILEEIIAEVKA